MRNYSHEKVLQKKYQQHNTIDWTTKKTLTYNNSNFLLLYRCCAQLHSMSTLGYLGEIVYQSFKDVGRVKITVIVHINVYHSLRIWNTKYRIRESAKIGKE